jgi:outer membrane protein OmpA-like peptidoglycan-associated protein
VAKPEAPAARTLVVLLPDADEASTGRVAVTTPAATQELTRSYEALEVTSAQQTPKPTLMTEAEVQRQFGDVLSNLPEAAQRFNLYFRTDRIDLTDESRALVPVVVKAVTTRKVAEVTVIGHTDTTGSRTSNYQLALKRAMALRALLVSAGIDGSLVEVDSHGEADLLKRTPDDTPEPLNRRVEITIK